jgi:hypothetical protein
LASEVVIDGYRGRVDLALFNGHMHAFEIKSDADRLDRLPNQLNRMLDHFERVVIVCTERHRKRVEAIVESSGRLRTGLWIIEESGRVDIVKRPKSSIVKDSRVLASFLLRSDIKGFWSNKRFRTKGLNLLTIYARKLK